MGKPRNQGPPKGELPRPREEPGGGGAGTSVRSCQRARAGRLWNLFLPGRKKKRAWGVYVSELSWLRSVQTRGVRRKKPGLFSLGRGTDETVCVCPGGVFIRKWGEKIVRACVYCPLGRRGGKTKERGRPFECVLIVAPENSIIRMVMGAEKYGPAKASQLSGSVASSSE